MVREEGEGRLGEEVEGEREGEGVAAADGEEDATGDAAAAGVAAGVEMEGEEMGGEGDASEDEAAGDDVETVVDGEDTGGLAAVGRAGVDSAFIKGGLDAVAPKNPPFFDDVAVLLVPAVLALLAGATAAALIPKIDELVRFTGGVGVKTASGATSFGRTRVIPGVFATALQRLSRRALGVIKSVSE